jgi:putative Holliday junction resolvase
VNHRTYLAFDYGQKHIGVAVGSSATGLAHPIDTVDVHRQQPDWDRLSRLIAEWRPHAFVVGLPLNMDGTENPMTGHATTFGNRLRGRYNLPVHFVDERLTSVAARQALADAGVSPKRHRSKVDRLAAQTILQAFFDTEAAVGKEKSDEHETDG